MKGSGGGKQNVYRSAIPSPAPRSYLDQKGMSQTPIMPSRLPAADAPQYNVDNATA
ncbi:hypothetical protein SL267_24360 [Serratia marcescens]|nr:hypothetical protein SL267_24360 [Serratia marcescens]